MESAMLWKLLFELVVFGGLFILIGVAAYVVEKREQKKLGKSKVSNRDPARIPHIRW